MRMPCGRKYAKSDASIRPKQYQPANPYPTPNYYPQQPLAVFDNPVLFEKFDMDALFFIFYYQQGTYQQ